MIARGCLCRDGSCLGTGHSQVSARSPHPPQIGRDSSHFTYHQRYIQYDITDITLLFLHVRQPARDLLFTFRDPVPLAVEPSGVKLRSCGLCDSCTAASVSSKASWAFRLIPRGDASPVSRAGGDRDMIGLSVGYTEERMKGGVFRRSRQVREIEKKPPLAVITETTDRQISKPQCSISRSSSYDA